MTEGRWDGGTEDERERGILMASGQSLEEAIQIDDLAAWEAWLEAYGGEGGQVWLAIYKKASSLSSSGIAAVQSTRKL